MGLCTDTYGNIIVADSDSGSIIVVSKDGLDSRHFRSRRILFVPYKQSWHQVYLYPVDHVNKVNHHKRIKSSRDHKTIDIQTYTSYIPPTSLIKTECDAHSLQFNLYCPSHLMPCCDECISTSHSQCTGITSLASVVEKTKIEKSKESVEKDINSITYFLDKLINNKSGNLKRGEQQYESIKQSVSKIRNEINTHLDHLEEQLFKETDTIWNLEKSKLTSLIHEIEDKQKILKEMKDDLKTVTENTSKLQCFLGLHQFEQQVSQCQRYIDNLEDSKRASEVDIKIKQNGELEKILKELQLIKSFGEVTVVNTEISLKRQTSVSREAQIELQEQSNIENMTMNIETTIPINISKHISDMICLMDGRVIVVEQMGLGLDGIRIIDLEGNKLKSIQVQSKSYLFNIVYCKDGVIYSDCDDKTVYCVDESGKKIWQHKHDLSGPRGLCIDTYGNIIVAGIESGIYSVKVISKDGQDSKVLVRKEDLGYTPRCICFKKHKESYGFICDVYGKSITRFNLSYD
ncbi:unnamed protein product [Mytilus edulis]|uniref:B box-type domain-containing protein n=1 Tax=Mytilus edulis TaxID=6550 RepID=A0A8S3Q957_MYTED|nr:unnamed protein product [Mytilus edulis]